MGREYLGRLRAPALETANLVYLPEHIIRVTEAGIFRSCASSSPPAIAINVVGRDLAQFSTRGALAHLDRAIEYGALFDQQHRSQDVAVDSPGFAYLYPRPRDQVAVERAMYYASADVHLGFDPARLAYDQSPAFASHLAIHPAIDLKPVGKNYIAGYLYAAADPAEV